MDKIEDILLTKIHSSKLNPRKVFDQEKLQELADSIKEKGLQQAITVRPSKEQKGKYEVVIGERRFRAVQLLKQPTINAIVRDIEDGEARTIMLIENLQREDLTELEEGLMYQELVKLGIPLREIARRIGKSHSYVIEKYNIVKKLSPVVKSLMEPKKGGSGTSKLDYAIAVKIARLPHREQEILAKKAVDYGYSQEKVVQVMKQAEETELAIESLPQDDFRKELEKIYLPKKFDVPTLSEVQIEIKKQTGTFVSKPKFESDFVPIMQKVESLHPLYPLRTLVTEAQGNLPAIDKAIGEIKKFVVADGSMYWIFILKLK